MTSHQSKAEVGKPRLFLLGIGFIGGSLLMSLLSQKKYAISALTRKEFQAERLKELGVTPVLGDLASYDIIKNEVIRSDVVIHAATAHDLPSVKAILDGIASRPDKSKPIVYIHTSGTGVLVSDSSSHVYNDTNPADIDARLPDSAPHRDIDLAIKRFVDKNEGGDNARIAIVLPPLIYGVGNGPFNSISIQVPHLIRTSAKVGYAGYGGDGQNVWNNIWIHNLIPGYLTILSHLSSESYSQSENSLYFFVEQGEHSWSQLAVEVGKQLHKKGSIKSPEAKSWGADVTDGQVNTNSHSKAQRLRDLGWKPEPKPTVFEAISDEIDVMIQAGDI